jgi:hypothetical protein
LADALTVAEGRRGIDEGDLADELAGPEPGHLDTVAGGDRERAFEIEEEGVDRPALPGSRSRRRAVAGCGRDRPATGMSASFNCPRM